MIKCNDSFSKLGHRYRNNNRFRSGLCSAERDGNKLCDEREKE